MRIERFNFRFSFALILSFILAILLRPAFAEIHGTQEASSTYYHVDGNQSRSFYPGNEAAYLYEGNVDFKNPLTKDYEMFGNIFYRVTDDKLIDTESFSIERMFIGLKGKSKELLLGDFYSNFSEYSLGNALKGARISIGDEDSSRLIMVGGIDMSKWEDLWENRIEGTGSRRYVWGTRLENNFLNKKLSLNFNYGGANDDTAYVPISGSPMMVNVFSMDGKYAINNHLTASGEIAESFTDNNTTDDNLETKSDYAMECGLDMNFKDYTLSSVFSRIGPHFNTTGGFSAQDLETINLDGMLFLPLKIKFAHYLHMSRDNLTKEKSTTTRQLNPGGKFSFTLPADFSLNLGADLLKRYSVDKSTNEETYTWTSSLSKDFGLLFATFGYTRTEVANQASPDQKRSSDLYSLGLDGNFTLKNVKCSWNLGEDIERIAYKTTDKADFTTSTSGGFKLNFPSTLAFQAKATIGDNRYYETTTNSYNTQYYCSLSRNILRKLTNDNLLFDVTYEHRSYRYFNNSNDYAERVLKGRFSYKF